MAGSSLHVQHRANRTAAAVVMVAVAVLDLLAAGEGCL